MKPTDEMVEAGAQALLDADEYQLRVQAEHTARLVLTAALATHQEEGAPLGHVTRISDSSLYDEVCESCGATDEQLKLPCPFAEDNTPTPRAGLGKAVEVLDNINLAEAPTGLYVTLNMPGVGFCSGLIMPMFHDFARRWDKWRAEALSALRDGEAGS